MTAQPTEREMERARALLNSFGLHPRTCGPTKAAAIRDRLAAALADAREAALREAYQAAKDEPELPGEPTPDELADLLADPVKSFRMTVRVTKASIMARIRALIGDGNG